MITKFTFKMGSRNKLVIQKPSVRTRSLVIKGKDEITIPLTKATASDLCTKLKESLKLTSGAVFKSKEYEIHVSYWLDKNTYILSIENEERELFSYSSVTTKQLKKIIHVMEKVWEIA